MSAHTARLTLAAFVVVACSQPAMAWGSFDVKLGKGEEVQVKKGLFGNRKLAAKDRLGDGIESSEGILGNKHQKVQVLGNGVEVNQGIFGNKSISAGTMLGDKFETHRSFFGLGPRTTRVDLSGVSSIAAQLLGPKVSSKGARGDFGGGADHSLSSPDKFPEAGPMPGLGSNPGPAPAEPAQSNVPFTPEGTP